MTEVIEFSQGEGPRGRKKGSSSSVRGQIESTRGEIDDEILGILDDEEEGLGDDELHEMGIRADLGDESFD